ncbi:MAG: ABC transporter ATP-binding protein [Armatimonadota bacterium]|nr:ABC transporter ATP-binding protein [Armatimonadota bacterium]MDR7427505.1 ABC transporter ATP-binding protein [Armatimonadota bacterium]MDR7463627.1 ABC transporter ATP-binding protein [Armatimonadota bacterium]MDR7469838.1 ABC transporter ATP-binding protein [Armatimonadota bacterium]MDR7475201.1 ABC transporter ATP-binding protein [Armatimonadota bacterium]
MATIALQRVRKQFGRVIAVDDVSLEIGDGEFMVLLGPSGCGKTTVLRCLAGLERVDSGRVFIGGRDVTDWPPARREIAMVFQSYAVFPHMTVFDNIAFGLRMRRLPPAEVRQRVEEGAALLQIDHLLDRYPGQLSGGQRQRVAVARAIVMRPQVLLMDEPLSNLDALLRLQMRAELKRLHGEVRSTTVYVTHDQVEALSLGERIAVMKDGRIVQCDTPARVYDTPVNQFVGGFIGNPPMNFLEAILRWEEGRQVVEVAGVSIPANGRTSAEVSGPVLLGIRPEHIAVSLQPVPEGIPARVLVLEPVGPQQLLTVEAGGAVLKVTTAVEFHATGGSCVWLRFDPARIRLMDARSGQALPHG